MIGLGLGLGLTRGGGIAPSLDLNFLTGTMPAGLTFTRASTATYIGSDGLLKTAAVDVPRLDYDPVTLACKGLLIEGARTNLLLNSATLATQSVTTTAQSYTLTFYGTGSVALSGAYTGSLAGTGASDRVKLTFTAAAGTLTLTVTGSVTQAQLEVGAFPSSYIPTTTAAVTRAADVCLMSGTDFSRWFNPNEGTFLWEFGPFNGVVIGGVGDTFDNVQYAPSSGFVTVRSAGAISAQMNAGSLAGGGKVSWAYKSNDFAASANGGAVATDTSGAVPLSNVRLKIGGSPWVAGADSEPYGPVSRLRYYPRRLSNARLQELTA